MLHLKAIRRRRPRRARFVAIETFYRQKRQTPHSSPGAGFWILRLVVLLRRALTRTSGANKYEGKKKQRAAHANSPSEEAGSEVALAAALRHGPNVNDARMPVNTCRQRIFTTHGNTPANGRIPCGFLYV